MKQEFFETGAFTDKEVVLAEDTVSELVEVRIKLVGFGPGANAWLTKAAAIRMRDALNKRFPEGK